MKDGILKLMELLEEIDNNWGWSDLQTAIYLYVRYGKIDTQKLTEEQIDKISLYLENFDGSLFNSEINDDIQDNIIEEI